MGPGRRCRQQACDRFGRQDRARPHGARDSGWGIDQQHTGTRHEFYAVHCAAHWQHVLLTSRHPCAWRGDESSASSRGRRRPCWLVRLSGARGLSGFRGRSRRAPGTPRALQEPLEVPSILGLVRDPDLCSRLLLDPGQRALDPGAAVLIFWVLSSPPSADSPASARRSARAHLSHRGGASGLPSRLGTDVLHRRCRLWDRCARDSACACHRARASS